MIDPYSVGVGGVGDLILNHKKEMKDVGSAKWQIFWRIVEPEKFEGPREQLAGGRKIGGGDYS